MDPESQELQLRRAGVPWENLFRDIGVSGSKGRRHCCGIQLIGWPDVGNGVKPFGQSWTRPVMLMPLIRSCP